MVALMDAHSAAAHGNAFPDSAPQKKAPDSIRRFFVSVFAASLRRLQLLSSCRREPVREQEQEARGWESEQGLEQPQEPGPGPGPEREREE
jgi:hypothetical protein